MLACSIFWLLSLNPMQKFANDVLAPKFFAWFASSDAVAAMHQQHVDSPTVRHMIKGSPLADAPDAAKIDFAKSAAGAAVADFMALEQQNIGKWKVDKIVEAAGAGFDAAAARRRLLDAVGSTEQRVVVFSFVDCPWCLLAKERLNAIAQSEGAAYLRPDELRVIELEDLGREGKELRAAIALATGRTSMPSVWVDGKCIGGFTDGEMPRSGGGGEAEAGGGSESLCLEGGSPGLEALEESGRLQRLLER